MNEKDNWYNILNSDQVDSPALVMYPSRMAENIKILKGRINDVHRLRPHGVLSFRISVLKSDGIAARFQANIKPNLRCAIFQRLPNTLVNLRIFRPHQLFLQKQISPGGEC